MAGIGFIGVGGMGSFQASAFSKVKGVKIVAGSDLSEASRANFAKTYPGAKVYASHQELLADPNVDAVVICVPTGFHLDVAADALKAGKPTLCEKPMARTVKQCQKMIELARKTGTLLMVGHCRRFDTDWGTMGKIVASGKLGRPVVWRQMAGGRGAPTDWFYDENLGGGPLLDGAVHNHDFANLMFGRPVSAIASCIDLAGTSAINTATAIVEYEKGDQMVLSWSWRVARSVAGGMDILGSGGTMNVGPAVLDDPKLDKTKYGYYCVTDRKTDKSSLVKFTRADMFVTQAKHFVDAAKGKTPCQSPPEEAIKAVAVAEAILKSARSHGKRVNVSW